MYTVWYKEEEDNGQQVIKTEILATDADLDKIYRFHNMGAIEILKTEEGKVLECSSAGDTRFAAESARVDVFGKTASIEEHFQLSKIFEGWTKATDWREAKGRKPIDFEIVKGWNYGKRLLEQWYKMLWAKYFIKHTELIEYGRTFDRFHDYYRGETADYVGADYVEMCIRLGPKAVFAQCADLKFVLSRFHYDRASGKLMDVHLNKEIIR